MRAETGAQALSFYTIMPVQRAMRFRLLLQDLLKHSRGSSGGGVPRDSCSQDRCASIQRSLTQVHKAIVNGEAVRER